MPYKCVHCSKVYEDGAGQVLSGCDSCKGKFFFYIKKEQIEKIKDAELESAREMSPSEKRQVEQEIREIVGVEDEEAPVFLDFESIKVLKPGKYAIDLANLFAVNKPRIYKLEDGKYIIDLSSALRKEEKA